MFELIPEYTMSNDLKNQIDAVEWKITSTAKEIAETNIKLDNPRSTAHEDFLMRRLDKLQDKENKLQDEKNKLQDK